MLRTVFSLSRWRQMFCPSLSVSTALLSLSDGDSVTPACLTVFVAPVWKGTTTPSNKNSLCPSLLNVTAAILWFPPPSHPVVLVLSHPTLPLLSPPHPTPPQSGAPSHLASSTKETCTWKSQWCHHCIECWHVPVPTGPGQHAVSAAGCLHTIRWASTPSLTRVYGCSPFILAPHHVLALSCCVAQWMWH